MDIGLLLSQMTPLWGQVKEADPEDILVKSPQNKGKVTTISSANFADAGEVRQLCAESKSTHEQVLTRHRDYMGKKMRHFETSCELGCWRSNVAFKGLQNM